MYGTWAPATYMVLLFAAFNVPTAAFRRSSPEEYRRRAGALPAFIEACVAMMPSAFCRRHARKLLLRADTDDAEEDDPRTETSRFVFEALRELHGLARRHYGCHDDKDPLAALLGVDYETCRATFEQMRAACGGAKADPVVPRGAEPGCVRARYTKTRCRVKVAETPLVEVACSTASSYDPQSAEGFLTKAWGPVFWNHIHTLAFLCDEKPGPAAAEWIETLGGVLPCRYCRENYGDRLKQAGWEKPGTLRTRRAFFEFTVTLHNAVNFHSTRPGAPRAVLDHTPRRVWQIYTDRFRQGTACGRIVIDLDEESP